MKKLILSLVIGCAAFTTQANTQSYKLVTASTYLNFYLLNLNACEDFHTSLRSRAYKAEGVLYPYFDKLNTTIDTVDIAKADQDAITQTLADRRAKLNAQIVAGKLTKEHCLAVIEVVEKGLDSKILEVL